MVDGVTKGNGVVYGMAYYARTGTYVWKAVTSQDQVGHDGHGHL
jgi:hypothetical protein